MIVYRWTGLESKVLREAMQCSIEGFAKRVGVGVRTVADWEARGKAAVMRPSSRALLDKALMNAPAEVLARFQRTMEGFPSGGEQPATGLLPTVTLANDALDVVPTVGVSMPQITSGCQPGPPPERSFSCHSLVAHLSQASGPGQSPPPWV